MAKRDRHAELLAVVKPHPADYAPTGDAGTEGPDCSCGCRWYVPLRGQLGGDWGVCSNPQSHRAGLLTFEHQGCWSFEGDPDD